MPVLRGRFTVGTGVVGTTYTISSIPFLPKAIFCTWSGRTDSVDAVGRASHQRGFGFATSTTSRRSVSSHSQDAQSSAVARMGVDETCVISTLLSGGGFDGLWDVSAFNSDNIVFVVDDQSTIALEVDYIIFGGDNFAAEIVTIPEPAATGDQDTTSLGIDPTAAIFIWNNAAAAAPSTSNDSRVGIGAAAGATPVNALWAGGSNTGAPTTQTMSYCLDGECIASLDVGVTLIQAIASVTAWLTGGFRLNWTQRSNTSRFYYALAMVGLDFAVAPFTTEDDTSTDFGVTGLDFAPDGGFAVSAGAAEDASDTPHDNDQWSIGTFDGSSQGAQATLDEDNVADTEVSTAIGYGEFYLNIALDSTLAGAANITSLDSGGFTARMTDADPTPSFGWAFLIGDATSAIGPSRLTVGNRLADRSMLRG